MANLQNLIVTGAARFLNKIHGDIDGDAATVNGKTVGTNVPADAKFTDNNTLNTAGSTNTSSKIFLIGATSQAANPQTYSHDTAYVGTDGCLYSGGTKTATTTDIDTLRDSFQDGCDTIAAAVTSNGGSISQAGTNPTPAEIATGIGTVKTNAASSGASSARVGNAVTANVLYGKTFTNSTSSDNTGSMPDNSSTADRGGSGTAPGVSSDFSAVPTRQGANLQMKTDTAGVSRISIGVPAGYWPGTGSAYVNRPASDFGNAATSNVLNTVTFTSTAGIKQTGGMINLNTNSSIKHTSSNATKVIVGDACFLTTNSDNVVRLQIRYNSTAGYLPANTLVGIPQATAATTIGLTAAKIYKGNTILGIAGTATTPESGKTGAAAAQILTGYQAFVNGSTINGSMKNYSSAIHAGTTSTSDQTKSIYRINGSTLEVIPAVGYWGTWDWNKSKITVTAANLGITAAKVLKGQSIMGVSGTGQTTHSNTYTLTASETGTKDLGANHTYRYVNAANVYNAGVTAGSNGKYKVYTTTLNATKVSDGIWYYTGSVTGASSIKMVVGFGRNPTDTTNIFFIIDNTTSDTHRCFIAGGPYATSIRTTYMTTWTRCVNLSSQTTVSTDAAWAGTTQWRTCNFRYSNQWNSSYNAPNINIIVYYT